MNMRRLLLCGLLLAAFVPAHAADWQFLGASSAGQHFVDPATLQWEPDGKSFSIATRVAVEDGSEWQTTMKVACAENRFRYLRGKQVRGDETLVSFDTPREDEAIQAGSMPDQLQKEYCRVADRQDIAWQVVGKSEIATVYYDPASVRQNREHTRFKVDTRVQPFKGDEQTFSSLSFDCAAQTFTVLRLSRTVNGHTEQVFDRPQQATPTSKTATLTTLAGKFCGKKAQTPVQAACGRVLDRIKAIEAQVQYDFDQGQLQCERAQAYLKDLGEVGAEVERLRCAVADLPGYMQTVRQAGCR